MRSTIFSRAWISVICLLLGCMLLCGCQNNNNAAEVESRQAYEETKILEETEAASEETKAENPAPDFTVLDDAGNEVKLSDYLGKPIVLNFWASWCGPCKSEMPDFDEVYRSVGDEVQFLMVNLTDGSMETTDTASEFIESTNYCFPVFFDVNGEAATAYGISSIPTTYFIDAEGNLVAYAKSAISAEVLMQGIDMIR